VRFGGQTQFGTGVFGGDPYGTAPGYVIRRILAELSRFKRSGTTGCIETLGRLTGSLSDPGTWATMLQAGTPAMLVVYEGGPFRFIGSGKNQIQQTQRYSVVCIASDYRERRHRLEGRNIHEPALDNLTRWARFYAARALLQMDGVGLRSGKEELRIFDASRFVGVVSFEVEAEQDLYDDAATLTLTLERLGIVHDPLDLDDLFLADEETPNTDSPTSPKVGYADLGDDAPDPITEN